MSARSWMDEGTRLFLGVVDRLTDDELSAPTALDGWTRRHVIAHVHGNAEALRRLLSWAATGVENRMYADARQRADEIEAAASLPAEELRALVHESARRLAEDVDALPEEAWHRSVVTAQGRTVPATEIPWMRARRWRCTRSTSSTVCPSPTCRRPSTPAWPGGRGQTRGIGTGRRPGRVADRTHPRGPEPGPWL